MNFSGPVERPKSLTDLAVERIRAAIVTGPLQFGEALSESVLAAMLGMSKTPVREALLRLRHEGLVEVHPQRGTFVFQLDETEVAHICQFRSVIECEALADAMKQHQADLVKALDTCLADMARASENQDTGAFPRLDTDFHDALVRHCDNSYLKASYSLISAQITALRYRLPVENEQVTHCQDNHRVVVDAIRNLDVRRAQSMLRGHIQSTRDAYLIACRTRVAPRPDAVAEAG
jgi:DNA-binding GntR family transcriptional regulator